MGIEEMKKSFIEGIEDIERDIDTLKNNIEVAKSVIDKINCEDDVYKYKNELDIEKDLQHIELF